MNDLLKRFGIRPLLVDIGASGKPPSIWNGIAEESIYVGFDPDRRDLHEQQGGTFFRSVLVNSAVVPDKGVAETSLYLTRSPYCSSTLPPDDEALADYLFADLFVVDRETRVAAQHLDEVLSRLHLPGIDWFKTDSQGIDLRLFRSLSAAVQKRILAVDVEPGLMDAYRGEDTFPKTHDYFVSHGFWLSSLKVCGTVRVRTSTLQALMKEQPGLDASILAARVRESPYWCETRYLRTLTHLKNHNEPRERYFLLWIFAMLDGQVGFAVDTALEYEKLFGRDDMGVLMKDQAVGSLREVIHEPAVEPPKPGKFRCGTARIVRWCRSRWSWR